MSLSPTLERVVIVVLLGALAFTWNDKNATASTTGPMSPEAFAAARQAKLDEYAAARAAADDGAPDAQTQDATPVGKKRSRPDKAKQDDVAARIGQAIGGQHARYVEATITLAEELAWTDERLDEVLDLLERREAALAEVGGTTKEAKAAMKKVSQKHYAELKSLLGKEHFSQWYKRTRAN